MMFTRPILRFSVYAPLSTTKRSMFYTKDLGITRDFLAKVQHFLSPKRSLDERRQDKIWKLLKEDQQYLEQRHLTLGPDLATAHFIVARGGTVKFVGDDKWIKKYDLPSVFVPDLYVEAINASGMPLMYETMKNLVYLDKLAYLNLSSCDYVDDFFLGALYRFEKSLVHLNISRCPLVTGAGIEILHRLKNLRILEVHGMLGVQNKELLALMLEDALPACLIEGIDYTDTKTLSMLPSNDLIQLDGELDRIDSTKLLKSSSVEGS